MQRLEVPVETLASILRSSEGRVAASLTAALLPHSSAGLNTQLAVCHFLSAMLTCPELAEAAFCGATG